MKLKLKKIHRLYKIDIPIVAITGNISSGKSFIRNLLSIKLNDEGIKHLSLSADDLVKEAYQRQEIKNFLNYYQRYWCHSFYVDDEQKVINFGLLRKIFFTYPWFKIKLEKKIYKLLPLLLKQKIKNNEQRCQLRCLLYEIPLLFEKSHPSKVDFIILAKASRSLLIERALKRDGSDKKLIAQILKNQIRPSVILKKCDFVILNDGNMSSLATLINDVFEKMRKFFL